jgi:hypothetical protein
MNGDARPPVRIYGTLKGHRRFFSSEDDKILRSLKESEPLITWAEISERMPGFTPRQLRERWCHYLSPSLNMAEWTPEEDDQLLALHTELGSQWGTIGVRMGNRSAPDVKNRFQSLRHRRERSRRSARRTASARVKESVIETPQVTEDLPEPRPPGQKEKPPPDKSAEFSISSILI